MSYRIMTPQKTYCLKKLNHHIKSFSIWKRFFIDIRKFTFVFNVSINLNFNCEKKFLVSFIFFRNFDFKIGFWKEFKDNNEKSCSWCSNRICHKIDLKGVWPHSGHADSVGVKWLDLTYDFVINVLEFLKIWVGSA